MDRVKKLIPDQLFQWFKYHYEFYVDRKLYRRYAGADDARAKPGASARNLEMQLTKDYHRVEKGLALPSPKRPFGVELLKRMETLRPTTEGAAPTYVQHLDTAMAALKQWNEGESIDDLIAPLGVQPQQLMGDPEGFFGSRRSVRHFSEEDVPLHLLDRAVELSLHTPSVCNRQPWHVRFFTDKQSVQHALSFQNGSAGFRDKVPAAALITVDRSMFAGANERNQLWIDGGLFSMTLVWALHSLGLSSCMLNMSQSHTRFRPLCAELNIPENEAIVMFIAIGYAADGHRVARSPRRSLNDVVRD